MYYKINNYQRLKIFYSLINFLKVFLHQYKFKRAIYEQSLKKASKNLTSDFHAIKTKKQSKNLRKSIKLKYINLIFRCDKTYTIFSQRVHINLMHKNICSRASHKIVWPLLNKTNIILKP